MEYREEDEIVNEILDEIYCWLIGDVIRPTKDCSSFKFVFKKNIFWPFKYVKYQVELDEYNHQNLYLINIFKYSYLFKKVHIESIYKEIADTKYQLGSSIKTIYDYCEKKYQEANIKYQIEELKKIRSLSKLVI